MSKLTELIALADAATDWDCNTIREFQESANPATVKRMAELLMQCREALIYCAVGGVKMANVTDALAALDAFEKEGK